MKILKPFKNFNTDCVTQGFHEKHRAIDCLPKRKAGLGGYGTPMVAPFDCTIGKIYGNKYTPGDLAPIKNGFGLFMKGDTLEVMYWHTQPFMPVTTGDVVKKGTIVAYCGNSGNVYQGGEYIPLERRNIPNFDGTHLHQTVYKKSDGILFDPMTVIDLNEEPNYGMMDELTAMAKTLMRMSGAIK